MALERKREKKGKRRTKGRAATKMHVIKSIKIAHNSQLPKEEGERERESEGASKLK